MRVTIQTQVRCHFSTEITKLTEGWRSNRPENPSAGLQKKIPRLVGRLGSRVQVSASFQIFTKGEVISGRKSRGEIISWIQAVI